jgi:hypothetical protein
MMRGIYLTVASIIPTGMYDMANWHAAEGVLRGFITRSVGPSAGEVPPSDPESRERLEILPVGAGDRVFPSSCDSKAT